jgi:hypothetical protein
MELILKSIPKSFSHYPPIKIVSLTEIINFEIKKGSVDLNFEQLDNGVQKIIYKAIDLYKVLDKEELQGIFELLIERGEINKKDVHIKLNEEISVAYLAIAFLGYLSITVESTKPFKSEWGNRDDSNFIFGTILTQIANYSLSIVKLVESGLDLQAKVLLRSLFEEINIFLVITAREDMMQKYCIGIDDESAFSVWSNNFKQSQLKRKISEIELELGLRKNRNMANWLKTNRNQSYMFLSSIAHGSFYTNLLGSYSFIQNEEIMPLALFGSYTEASNNTLGQLNWQIYYFTIMLNAILDQIHKFVLLKEDDDLFNITEALKQIFLNSYLRFLHINGKRNKET